MCGSGHALHCTCACACACARVRAAPNARKCTRPRAFHQTTPTPPPPPPTCTPSHPPPPIRAPPATPAPVTCVPWSLAQPCASSTEAWQRAWPPPGCAVPARPSRASRDAATCQGRRHFSLLPWVPWVPWVPWLFWRSWPPCLVKRASPWWVAYARQPWRRRRSAGRQHGQLHSQQQAVFSMPLHPVACLRTSLCLSDVAA